MTKMSLVTSQALQGGYRPYLNGMARHIDEFVATEGQTVFNLEYEYDPYQDKIDVVVGGVPQYSPDNFVESSSTSFTLSEGVPVGTEVVATYFSETQPLNNDLGKEVANHTSLLELHNAKIENLSMVINVTDSTFGAKGDYYLSDGIAVNPSAKDNTVAIQSAIDSLGAKGGRIRFPVGTYLVKGTITIRKNIILEGIGQVNGNTDNAGYNHNSVIIYHQPVAANVDLFVGDVAQPNGYIAGISIKNMNLYGTNNSRYAIKIDKAHLLDIDRLVITQGFTDGIVCDYFMHSKISNCFITGMKNAPIRFTGGVSTTVVIEKCYLRESPWAFIAEAGTCYGVNLNDCIFETCSEGGLDIHVDNRIFISNPYTENIPSAPSAKPIFQIGVNGVPQDITIPKSNVVVQGGFITGCSFGVDANSSAISIDKTASFTMIGSTIQSVGQLIKTTVNTKIATIIGISEFNVPSTKGGIYDTSRVIFIGYNEMNVANPYLDVSQIRFTGQNKWTLTETYAQTDGDLIFDIGGEYPFWLDANKNIRNQYTGAVGTTKGVNIFGEVTPPSFGVLNAFAQWAENVDGVVQFKQRNGDGTIYTNFDLAVDTNDRPTTGNYPGRTMFDTILNKPIWRNAANDGWVDPSLIQSITSDPLTPAIGQMWLRSDL